MLHVQPRQLLAYLFLLTSCFFLLASPASAQTRRIVVDHTAVELFDTIPSQYIQSASSLRLMLRHASIGDQINSTLDCFQNGNCGYPAGLYNRSNWSLQSRGNPGYGPKIDDFVSQTQAQLSQRQVFMFKFCYIDYADPWCPNCTSPWDRLRDGYLAADTIASGSNQHIVWWTMPLTKTVYPQGDSINQAIRQHVLGRNLILFDIADLESHDPNGNPVRDANGYEIPYTGWCAETGEFSCHLSSPARTRVVKALWVLMAQIAGWQPGSPPPPTITTAPPSPSPLPGNLDNDSDVDFIDLLRFLPFFNTTNSAANFNSLGLVDIFDWNLLLRNL